MPTIPADVQLRAGELTLRLPSEDDVPRITELCQDPDIARWTNVPSPYTADHAWMFVTAAAREAGAGTSCHLCVYSAEDVLIGACGLPRIDWSDLVAEVGYWIAADQRGRGVATTAARTVCRWAFGELGFERLTLQAAAPNVASNAVARSLGFVHEGTDRLGAIDGHTGEPGSLRIDMERYGLLPEELVA